MAVSGQGGIRERRTCAAALFALALAACIADGHDHGDDVIDEHDVRDPATEPCHADNWRELYPDLRECALAGQTLDGASLRRADLTDADLRGARLRDADLFKAILLRATLADADLRRAKLIGADLGGASLLRAQLGGADLLNARLAGTLLDGAVTDATTICPAGNAGPCW